MWLKTGDIVCDTCSQEFNHPGPRVVVANGARAKGWHMFQGKSLTGKPLDTHLCPACVGTNRSAVKTQAKSLDEDVPLF